jgi:uncharacterized protein YqjF (DUF2071 family)
MCLKNQPRGFWLDVRERVEHNALKYNEQYFDEDLIFNFANDLMLIIKMQKRGNAMKKLNTDHRPWAIPNEQWIMKQTWEYLLFAHWEINPFDLRSLIPSELTIDTYDGKAWIAVVPFGMSGIHLRGLPAIPGTSEFPELNVRTYVTYQGKPGVYFFSLDAANRIAVAVARRFFRLPYYKAEMNLSQSDGVVSYTSRRTHKGGKPAEFLGSYAPCSDVYLPSKGSLESWLVERYCLYTVYGGKVYRGEIHHEPWPLQNAEAEIHINTMSTSNHISIPESKPLLHYAQKLNVLIWPLQRC